METNSRLSTRHTKSTVTPKFNSYNGNMAFAKLRRTQSLARPTTHAAIPTFSTSHKSMSSPYRLFTHNLSKSPAAQTQTTFSMLQIKTILKNTFQLNVNTNIDLQISTHPWIYKYQPTKEVSSLKIVIVKYPFNKLSMILRIYKYIPQTLRRITWIIKPCNRLDLEGDHFICFVFFDHIALHSFSFRCSGESCYSPEYIYIYIYILFEKNENKSDGM